MKTIKRKSVIIYTCVFIIQNNKILLGYKKRGLLKGLWNGFGGKVEPGETILNAAIRELEEECGLKSDNMIEHGILTVEDESFIHKVYLFTSTAFTGTIAESNEMIPKWFLIEKIPYDKMCCDGKFWLPLLLERKKFNVYCRYDEKRILTTCEISQDNTIIFSTNSSIN